MASGLLHSEALIKLINAVNAYKASLEENIGVLADAANVCSQAMGSDDVSSRYIESLDMAVVKLRQAVSVAEDAVEELKDDYNAARLIEESI